NNSVNRTLTRYAGERPVASSVSPMAIDQGVQSLLVELRAAVQASADGAMYGNRVEALRDIDAALALPSTDKLKWLLAPTGNLQELSIANGWGQQFNELAAKLEQSCGSA